MLMKRGPIHRSRLDKVDGDARKIGKPSESMTWIMIPAANDRHPKVSLTFDVTGRDHVLRTIQYETFATPNLDRQPKHKAEEHHYYWRVGSTQNVQGRWAPLAILAKGLFPFCAQHAPRR